MFETFFGFKKIPFSDEPDAKQYSNTPHGNRFRHG